MYTQKGFFSTWLLSVTIPRRGSDWCWVNWPWLPMLWESLDYKTLPSSQNKLSKNVHLNPLLPGHKLEWPIFTTSHPVPGHERVNPPFCTGKDAMQDWKKLVPSAPWKYSSLGSVHQLKFIKIICTHMNRNDIEANHANCTGTCNMSVYTIL